MKLVIRMAIFQIRNERIQMVQNEKGITLIELLAALVLFGIFSTIIWAFFFQSTQANNIELTKNKLQQEANLIISTLQEVHKKSNLYTVILSEDSLVVDSDTVGTYIFDKPDITYEMVSTPPINSRETIHPKRENFTMTLIVTSKENANIQTTIHTVFSRIK